LELAARPFLIELQIRKLLARSGEFRVVSVAGFLERGVLCFALGDLL
jgi:hypothetical protein